MYNDLERFADEDYVLKMLYELKWPDGKIICPICNGTEIREFSHPSMPFWCADCQNFFSIKHGTLMQNSRLPLHNWVTAVAYDLNSIAGISATNLGKVLGISRKSSRLLLNQISKVLTLVNVPEEFEYGKIFRIDEIPYDVKKSSIQDLHKASENEGNYNRYIIICITESKSNKVWVEVVPTIEPNIVSGIVEKVIPKGAYIFKSQSFFFGDLSTEKYTIRPNKDEFGELSTAWAKYLRKNIRNHTGLAYLQLENSFANVYHQMTFDQLVLYVKAFVGRWNIQEWDIERRIQLVFSVILNIERQITFPNSKNG